MTNRWWEKFLNLFTEEISTEKEAISSGNLPGRIGEMDHDLRMRVIHHYPQSKEFNTPVIHNRTGEIRVRRRQHSTSTQEVKNSPARRNGRDRSMRTDEQRGKARQGQMERKKRRNAIRNEEEIRPPREKFTGVNFRASDVPSPIYGFRERPVSRRDPSKKTKNPEPTNSEISSTSSYEKFGGWGETVADYAITDDYGTDKPKSKFGSSVDMGTTQVESDSMIKREQLDSHVTVDNERYDLVADKQEDILYQQEEEPSAEDNTAESAQEMDSVRVTNSAQETHSPEETSYIPSNDQEKASSLPYNVVMLKRDREKQDRSVIETEGTYQLPSPDLLDTPPRGTEDDEEWINEQGNRLSETLQHFNVKASVVGVTKGPAVTRFEVQPAPGVKVNKIKKLNDDLKLSLAAKDIRIEAPIPGKSTVGIEIPNRTSQPVHLREMIESDPFCHNESPLTAALGLDISGVPIVTNLQKMPHGLIGGATGSGKSVCINSLLISLLYKATPDELKLILIDPKVVELAPFKDIPHLAAPVINDAKEAALALKWAVEEMERRYEQFAEAGARDIARYNRQADEHMPYIVIIIDELADLMMVAPHDVEESICRIAQKARACGIHLVLATQRPSVDVITGLIKANIPTRLAFSVSSQADSRTILDMGGAEKLLGHGDMLFVENGAPQAVRVQGNFVSDDEIDRITDYVKQQSQPDYLFEKEELQQTNEAVEADDDLFEDACFFVFEQGSASASSLQRRFRIGYNRAARLIEMMHARGMISEAMGSKPRDILLSEDEFLDKITNQEA